MHVKHVCLPADLGPAFVGLAATIEGTVTCLITPRVRDDEAVKHQAAELLRRAGISCGHCPSCPFGFSSQEA